MKNLIVFFALFGSATAFADGFVCLGDYDRFAVKVYNHTTPSAGTRNGAVMVISDTTARAGSRTVAKFTDTNLLLKNSASVYTANVDHRFSDISKDGNIGGVDISAVKKVVLDIDFSYADPVAADVHVNGNLYLTDKTGETVSFLLNCKRYLKN